MATAAAVTPSRADSESWNCTIKTIKTLVLISTYTLNVLIWSSKGKMHIRLIVCSEWICMVLQISTSDQGFLSLSLSLSTSTDLLQRRNPTALLGCGLMLVRVLIPNVAGRRREHGEIKLATNKKRKRCATRQPPPEPERKLVRFDQNPMDELCQI